ncbi:hypothetical protein CONLIGDRAFT_638706 [Coniochaeta ligniaria NRRL 30616]|uniref:Uncharacterized protein n=1 Tax=Coniochaeta ligniaria NRRL 30616 TaxID=1408157 RepID=A0A1J7J2L0_9PEZI|nr:hypothetical protein CONLIGDRAFT_638706 [Coniochaeta ligniaria NRRL 30616]
MAQQTLNGWFSKALHQKKETWACEYPGRNFSYRRHMREIHAITMAYNSTWKVGDPNEPVAKSSTSTVTVKLNSVVTDSASLASRLRSEYANETKAVILERTAPFLLPMSTSMNA